MHLSNTEGWVIWVRLLSPMIHILKSLSLRSVTTFICRMWGLELPHGVYDCLADALSLRTGDWTQPLCYLKAFLTLEMVAWAECLVIDWQGLLQDPCRGVYHLCSLWIMHRLQEAHIGNLYFILFPKMFLVPLYVCWLLYQFLCEVTWSWYR